MAFGDPKVVSPRFAQALGKRLRKMKISRTGFVDKFHQDHDDLGNTRHLHKIMTGQVFVGTRDDELLPLICRTANLDLDEMRQLVAKDRAEHEKWKGR